MAKIHERRRSPSSELMASDFVSFDAERGELTTRYTPPPSFASPRGAVQGGLIANDWQKLRSEVGKIPELRFSTGYLAGTTRGATRGQDGTCGIILNKKN